MLKKNSPGCPCCGMTCHPRIVEEVTFVLWWHDGTVYTFNDVVNSSFSGSCVMPFHWGDTTKLWKCRSGEGIQVQATDVSITFTMPAGAGTITLDPAYMTDDNRLMYHTVEWTRSADLTTQTAYWSTELYFVLARLRFVVTKEFFSNATTFVVSTNLGTCPDDAATATALEGNLEDAFDVVGNPSWSKPTAIDVTLTELTAGIAIDTYQTTASHTYVYQGFPLTTDRIVSSTVDDTIHGVFAYLMLNSAGSIVLYATIFRKKETETERECVGTSCRVPGPFTLNLSEDTSFGVVYNVIENLCLDNWRNPPPYKLFPNPYLALTECPGVGPCDPCRYPFPHGDPSGSMDDQFGFGPYVYYGLKKSDWYGPEDSREFGGFWHSIQLSDVGSGCADCDCPIDDVLDFDKVQVDIGNLTVTFARQGKTAAGATVPLGEFEEEIVSSGGVFPPDISVTTAARPGVYNLYNGHPSYQFNGTCVNDLHYGYWGKTSVPGSISYAASRVLLTGVDDNDVTQVYDSDIQYSHGYVLEGAASGTKVGITAFAEDADGSAVTYAITADSSGGLFAIGSTTGIVTTTAVANVGTHGSSPTITVEATSADTSVSEWEFTITIEALATKTIYDSDTAANTIPDNATFGAGTGLTVQVHGTTATYELISNPDGRFAIDSTTGVVTVHNTYNLDYAKTPFYDINVKVTYADATTGTKKFRILVSDANEWALSSSSFSQCLGEISKDTPVGTVVGRFQWNLIADLEGFTYKDPYYNYYNFFTTLSDGRVVLSKPIPTNYSSVPIRVICFATSGSGLWVGTIIAYVNLTTRNKRYPVVYGSTEFPARAGIGVTIPYRPFITDYDPSQTITYSLVTNPGGRYAINTTTGEIRLATARTQYYNDTIEFRATSSDTTTLDGEVTLKEITTPNNYVDVTFNTGSVTLAEDAAIGSAVTTIDPYEVALPTKVYSNEITDSSGLNWFRVDPDDNNDIITAADLDYELTDSVTIIKRSVAENDETCAMTLNMNPAYAQNWRRGSAPLISSIKQWNVSISEIDSVADNDCSDRDPPFFTSEEFSVVGTARVVERIQLGLRISIIIRRVASVDEIRVTAQVDSYMRRNGWFDGTADFTQGGTGVMGESREVCMWPCLGYGAFGLGTGCAGFRAAASTSYEPIIQRTFEESLYFDNYSPDQGIIPSGTTNYAQSTNTLDSGFVAYDRTLSLGNATLLTHTETGPTEAMFLKISTATNTTRCAPNTIEEIQVDQADNWTDVPGTASFAVSVTLLP